jgi:hypothetical protein
MARRTSPSSAESGEDIATTAMGSKQRGVAIGVTSNSLSETPSDEAIPPVGHVPGPLPSQSARRQLA